MPLSDESRIKMDYEQAWGYMKHLSEIRFKLLTVVPAVTGVAATVLSTKESAAPWTVLAVGLLGLIATFGVIIYELRNSEIYEQAGWRIGQLERSGALAAMPRLWPETKQGDAGGIFNERNRYEPSERPTFGLVPIKHDVALALIYAGAMAGWAFIIVRSIQQMPAPEWYRDTEFTKPYVQALVAALVPMVVGTGVYIRIVQLDHGRDNLRKKAEQRLRNPQPGAV